MAAQVQDVTSQAGEPQASFQQNAEEKRQGNFIFAMKMGGMLTKEARKSLWSKLTEYSIGRSVPARVNVFFSKMYDKKMQE